MLPSALQNPSDTFAPFHGFPGTDAPEPPAFCHLHALMMPVHPAFAEDFPFLSGLVQYGHPKQSSASGNVSAMPLHKPEAVPAAPSAHPYYDGSYSPRPDISAVLPDIPGNHSYSL